MISYLTCVVWSLLSGIKYGVSYKDKLMLLAYILSSIVIIGPAFMLFRTRALEWFRNSSYQDWLKDKTVTIKRDKVLVEIPFILDYINIIKPEYLKKEADYLGELHLCDGNKAFFDIGANMGLFSLRLAKAYPNAKIIAVEASTKVYERLRKNLNLNNLLTRVNILQRAVTDKDDTFVTLCENDSKSFILDKSIQRSDKSDSNLTHSRVLTVTIDSLVTTYNLTEITLLKVDIEGGEVNAVLGAQKSLEEKKIKNLMIEFHTIENRDSLNQILIQFGYTLLHQEHTQSPDRSIGHIFATVSG